MAWADTVFAVGVIFLLFIVSVVCKLYLRRQRYAPDRRRAARRQQEGRSGSYNATTAIGNVNDDELDDALYDDWEEMRLIFQLAPHLLAHHRFYASQQLSRIRYRENNLVVSERQQQEMMHRQRQSFIAEMLLYKKVVPRQIQAADNSSNVEEEEEDDSSKPCKTATSSSNKPNKNTSPRRLKSDLVLSKSRSSKTIKDGDGFTSTSGSGEEQGHLVDNGDDETESETQHTDDDGNDDETCPICLKEYQVNEEICWSPNKDCHHAFHRECIEEWLLRHEECPCCRQNYLNSSRIPPPPTTTTRRTTADSAAVVTSHNNYNNDDYYPNWLFSEAASLSDGGDFLEMLASIERMYRATHTQLLYRNNLGGGSHRNESAPPEWSPTSSTATTTASNSSHLNINDGSDDSSSEPRMMGTDDDASTNSVESLEQSSSRIILSEAAVESSTGDQIDLEQGRLEGTTAPV